MAVAKNFASVAMDFCWMWIINPAVGRRALSDMLDTVPANKLHHLSNIKRKEATATPKAVVRHCKDCGRWYHLFHQFIQQGRILHGEKPT